MHIYLGSIVTLRNEFGIVIDWETSGLRPHETPWRTYMEGPQGIELGVVLVNLPSFSPVAEFSTRVKFLGTCHGISYGGPLHENLTWSDEAQTVHGISVSDLKDAPSPAQAAQSFIDFVLTNTGIVDLLKHPIMICGHNPSGDAYSLRQLLFLGGAERKIRFHHRMIDSFTAGYMTLGTKSSNELFAKVSNVVRGTHSALQDARLTLDALQHIAEYLRECQKHVLFSDGA